VTNIKTTVSLYLHAAKSYQHGCNELIANDSKSSTLDLKRKRPTALCHMILNVY